MSITHATRGLPGSFNKLVKLVARAFYDDFTANGDKHVKSGRSDKGIAVVVLDPLTRRQWVREEKLAQDLKLNLKQLRRTLQFFEEEKLVTRDHRKETANGSKAYSAAVAATPDNLPGRGDEKIKLQTHSYCCIDHAQIHDVVRYRLHHMRKKLIDEVDNKKTVQEYVCPKRGKRYNALDVSGLISSEDDGFHCESCNTELVEESGKASQDIGDGHDNARRLRLEKSRDLLQKLAVQLKPLTDHLNIRIKDLDAPDYGTLQAWEHASAVARASNCDPNASDTSLYGQGGTPKPFLGDIKVEVVLSGVEEKKIKAESEPPKISPPWLDSKYMNLTNEESVGLNHESSMAGTYACMDLKGEKKSIRREDNAKKLQRRKEQEATMIEQNPSFNNFPTDVDSSKSRKRQHGDDAEGDVEWQETPTAAKSFKVDLTGEKAEPSGNNEDDDGIDWEEG